MRELGSTKLKELIGKWYGLGIGYAQGYGDQAGRVYTPEFVLIETLPYLPSDLHMAGLILSWLNEYGDLVCTELLEQEFELAYPDKKTAEGQLVLLLLYALSSKVKTKHDQFKTIASFSREGLSPTFIDQAKLGYVQLWPDSRDRPLRLIMSLCPPDASLKKLGIRFPEITAAAPKKLRSRDIVLKENSLLASREALNHKPENQ